MNDLFIKYKNEGEEAFKDYLKGKEIVISEKTDNKNKLVEGQTISNKNMLTDGDVANKVWDINEKNSEDIAQKINTNQEKEKEGKNEEKNNIGQNSNEKIDNEKNLNKKEETNSDNDVTNNIKKNNKEIETSDVV